MEIAEVKKTMNSIKKESDCNFLEESGLPQILEVEDDSEKLLPTKSKKKYYQAYDRFMEWKKSKKTTLVSESLLLAYFTELSALVKPSTLWSNYSMLKSTLKNEANINIEYYTNLTAFLRKESSGFKSQQAKILSSDDIERFLNEAPDHYYLAMKAVLILGITGACRRQELYNLRMSDLKDCDTSFLITIPETNNFFTVTGEFYRILKKYISLRPKVAVSNHLFLNYKNGRCSTQVIGINKFGSFPKQIASYLNLPDAQLYTGHSFRRTSANLLADSGANVATLKFHYGRNSAPVAHNYDNESIQFKEVVSNLITESIILNSSSSSDNLCNQSATLENFGFEDGENSFPHTEKGSCKCSFGCSSLTLEHRQELWKEFYNLKDNKKQQDYLSEFIRPVLIAVRPYRKSNVSSNNRNVKSIQYFLPIAENTQARVCEKTFLETFALKQAWLLALVHKITNGGVDCSESRDGRKNAENEQKITMSSSENEGEFGFPDAGQTIDCPGSNLPTLKSKMIYESAYHNFVTWKNGKGLITSESSLMAYFEDLTQKYKPTTLWAQYSMLKSTINLNEKIDISQFSALSAYLKTTSRGFRSKKAKTFTTEQVQTFLFDAPDDIYLVTKVVLIFGVSGACRGEEISKVKVQNIEDHGDLLLVRMPEARNKKSRSFTINAECAKIVKKYRALRPQSVTTDRFFLNYQKEKCTIQVIGKNKISRMPKQIATYLHLPDAEAYTGYSFRRTSFNLLADSGVNIITLKRHIQQRSYPPDRSFTNQSTSNNQAVTSLSTEQIANKEDALKEHDYPGQSNQLRVKSFSRMGGITSACFIPTLGRPRSDVVEIQKNYEMEETLDTSMDIDESDIKADVSNLSGSFEADETKPEVLEERPKVPDSILPDIQERSVLTVKIEPDEETSTGLDYEMPGPSGEISIEDFQKFEVDIAYRSIVGNHELTKSQFPEWQTNLGQKSIMWSFWEEDFARLEKRVIIMNDLKVRIFLRLVEVSLHGRENVKNLEDIVGLLKEVSVISPCGEADEKDRAKDCMRYVPKKDQGENGSQVMKRCFPCRKHIQRLEENSQSTEFTKEKLRKMCAAHKERCKALSRSRKNLEKMVEKLNEERKSLQRYKMRVLKTVNEKEKDLEELKKT